MANPLVEQLQSKLRHKLTIEDPVLGKMEWTLRPIPAYDLMENIELFDRVDKEKEINIDPKTMNKEDKQRLKTQIFPIMKIFLPACSVDPPIAIEDDDPRIAAKEAIHIRDVPLHVIGMLFSKITEISGLTKAVEEERKKLLEAKPAGQ